MKYAVTIAAVAFIVWAWLENFALNKLEKDLRERNKSK